MKVNTNVNNTKCDANLPSFGDGRAHFRLRFRGVKREDLTSAIRGWGGDHKRVAVAGRTLYKVSKFVLLWAQKVIDDGHLASRHLRKVYIVASGEHFRLTIKAIAHKLNSCI